MSQYNKQWRAENPEKKYESDKRWREANPEKMRAYRRKWNRANKQYFSKWHAEHPGYKSEQTRRRKANPKYREHDLQHQREQSKKYPEKYRIRNVNRRARKRNLPNNLTVQQWERAVTYWNGCCAICGSPPGFWHVLAKDHWIPLSYNHPDNPGTVATNILPLCHAKKDGDGGCNNSKSTAEPVEWLIRTFGERKAKVILKKVLDYFAWVKEQDQSE